MKRCFLSLVLLSVSALAANGFNWSVKGAGNTLELTLTVKPGGSVYSESVVFDVSDADGRKLSPSQAPAAQDSFGAGSHLWRFNGKAPFSGTVGYQGCGKSADGTEICYAPAGFSFKSGIADKSGVAGTRTVKKSSGFKLIKSTSGYMSKEKFLAFLDGNPESGDSKAELGAVAMFLLALLGGIGLNLTPCILPMIPINLAIIGASGSGRKTGFIRGICYGSGMAAAYGILGVVVVLSGAPFGSLNSSYIFNFIIAAIFILLAVAMAGFINFDLSRYRRFDVSKLGKTREIAAFLMGGVSALLAGACVAPVVVTVLLFASSSYNDGNFFALFLPFMLGIGMALPWPFAGAGLAVLPKPNGKIMNVVKAVFVALILAAGAWYIYTGWKLLPGKSDNASEFAKLENALAESRVSGKKVLIDFWAPWCKNCHAMEKEVLNTPEVKRALEKYIFVKFNAQDISNEQIAGLLAVSGIPGLPGYALVEAAGVTESR